MRRRLTYLGLGVTAMIFLCGISCPKPQEPTFDPGFVLDKLPGEEPTKAQLGCLNKTPKPDCPLDDATRAILRVGFSAFPTAEDVITFHNDNVSGGDRSVDVVFKEQLLGKQLGPPDFYQHTHGTSHTLFVTQNTGSGVTATGYLLQPDDEIRFFYAARGQQLPGWQDILGGNTPPNMTITKTANVPSGIEFPNCTHVVEPTAPNSYWRITTAYQATDKGITPVNGLPSIGDIHTFGTPDKTFMRRIVIRNKNGVPRHYIKVDNNCAAFKICTRTNSADCDRTPLCLLEAPPNCEGK